MRPGAYVRSLPRRARRAVLVAFVALLIGGGGAAAGTWAAFSASTNNDATFKTGALLLSNKVGAVSTCFSTASGDAISDNDEDCDALFSLTVRKPGDLASSDVDIKNEGDLVGDLSTYMPSCTDSNASGTSYHGVGDLCDALEVTIQEYASAAARTAGSAVGGNCRYGAATGAGVACAFDAAKTLDDFVAAHGAFTSALALGATTPAQTRWFRISLSFPTATDNTYQGRAATFGLGWRLVQ